MPRTPYREVERSIRASNSVLRPEEPDLPTGRRAENSPGKPRSRAGQTNARVGRQTAEAVLHREKRKQKRRADNRKLKAAILRAEKAEADLAALKEAIRRGLRGP